MSHPSPVPPASSVRFFFFYPGKGDLDTKRLEEPTLCLLQSFFISHCKHTGQQTLQQQINHLYIFLICCKDPWFLCVFTTKKNTLKPKGCSSPLPLDEFACINSLELNFVSMDYHEFFTLVPLNKWVKNIIVFAVLKLKCKSRIYDTI